MSRQKYVFCSLIFVGLCIILPYLQQNTSFFENNTNILKNERKAPQLFQDTTPEGADGEDWTYSFGSNGISSAFSVPISSEELIVIATDNSQFSSAELVILTYPEASYVTYGLSNYDETVTDIYKAGEDSIVVLGTKTENVEYGNTTAFVFTYDVENRMCLNGIDLTIGDENWIVEYQVLANNHLLLLVKYFIDFDIGLQLVEVDLSSGSIIWQKDYFGISYDSFAAMDNSLRCLHLTDSEEIILVSTNSSEDGLFLSRGSIGGSWNNYSFSHDLDLKGCVIDNNDYVHAAVEYSGDIHVLKIQPDGDLEANYSLASMSFSYSIQQLLINPESTGNHFPFLIYRIWGVEDNSGLGYGYINGGSLEQQVEFLPSNTYSHEMNTIMPYQGDFIFGLKEADDYNSELTMVRVGQQTWVEVINYYDSLTFTELAILTDIQSDEDGYIWFRIPDDSLSAGVGYLDAQYGNVQDYFEIGLHAILCHFQYISSGENDYIAFYGMTGDMSENEGIAFLATYDLTGNLIQEFIRAEHSGEKYNEAYEMIFLAGDAIFLTGYQVFSDPYGQNLIVAKYSIAAAISPWRSVESVQINSEYELTDYYADIFTGTGTSEDPYIFEYLIIDGESEQPGEWDQGFTLKNLGDSKYITIRHCIIRNWRGYGVDIRFMAHITVYNCTIENNGNYAGLFLEDVRYSNISSNTIRNNQGFGIMTSSNMDFYENIIEFNTITGNYAYPDTDDWTGNGIGLERGYNNKIRYNTINGHTGWGIRIGNVWDEDEIYTYDNEISFNDLCDNDKGGINWNDMEDWECNTFSNNTCDGKPDSTVFDDIPGFSMKSMFLFSSLSIGIIILLLQKQKRYVGK